MRRTGKLTFFIVLLVIIALTTLSFLGVRTQYGDVQTVYIKGAQDIRWGIDIRGGVDVTFSPADGYDATDNEMAAAEDIIKTRLVQQNITDYEVYTDYNKDRIIVRFPWRGDEAEFNAEKAIQELGETALLSFREGVQLDDAGYPTGTTLENIILQGTDVEEAVAGYTQDPMTGRQDPIVSLKLSSEGTRKFSEATARLVGQQISIWMDDTLLSAPVVSVAITDGNAMISGMEDIDSAKDLANKITAGALPFRLTTENYSTISPTLGQGALNAMMLAGVIAFVLIALMMIVMYRLPGAVAVIALTGQLGLMIASITGFFPGIPSFTLTLPGIAGIILSIGVGVDCNVITAERIKEELRSGKTLDGAISTGFKRAFTAIFDGNVTIIIVSVILMGAFGPPGGFFATLLTPFFFMFGPATTGTIYSFGYTLLMGVLFNFVMGIMATRLMIKSISRFQPLRRVWLYGGEENNG